MATVTAFRPRLRPAAVPPPGRPAWLLTGGVRGPVSEALRRLPAPRQARERVVAVELGQRFRHDDGAALLRALASARRHGARLALFHAGAGGASLLRAAAREDPVDVVAVEIPAGSGASCAAVTSALSVAGGTPGGSRERSVDRSGAAWETRWEPLALHRPMPPSGRGGVVVVTGGLGGIGLRVAAVLARELGAHPVLVDQVDPASLPGSEQRRLVEIMGLPAGASVCRADVTDARQVAAALAHLRGGAVTGVVHCAGTLGPGPVDSLTPADLTAVRAVKVDGLHNVLAALDARRLRHVVVFGSVTAVAPHGQLGAYALANEVLARETMRLAATLPRCTTVAAQWSVWAGAGMTHRLGVVGQAKRLGMSPIPLGGGLGALRDMLALPPGGHSLVLAGGHAPRPDGTDAALDTVAGRDDSGAEPRAAARSGAAPLPARRTRVTAYEVAARPGATAGSNGNGRAGAGAEPHGGARAAAPAP